MDPYIHTLIAVCSLAIAYFIGRYDKLSLDEIVSNLLEKLEQEGFIATELDKDGDKELIPVSELVANALVDAKKTLTKSKN